MKTLLRADVYRIWRKKRLLLLTLAVMCIALLMVKTAGEQDALTVITRVLRSGTLLLPVMFIPIYLFTWHTDFTSRAVNNVLISGVSRKVYFGSKILLTYMVGTVLVAAYSLSAILSAYVLLGSFNPEKIMLTIGLQIILYYIVLSLGFMIYTLVRTTALPTALYLLIVLLGENLLNVLMSQMKMDAGRLSPYLLFQNLSRVVNIGEFSHAEWTGMIIGGFVIWSVTVGWSWVRFSGEELK
ncbi:hypothetical protein R70723_07675 [Paenibacillus sp. FSL R7-0273]|uniref:ABC transporter permease n=1 Tax=Paenibacillus sp. FSL R7-0273 TaxID=1536772 RepID=UPI0004F7596D|nr:ABC transporter permease [Paenibacillus sp. FSL R7-0273]AIQ45774.1 hypothetical protein R70723_07675 [Paenibacillus sp. FSL R7-0273]OMF95298.1 hypothetical protein BK144_07175 [Paenibacillus sp. FSL R7-0273]